MTLTSLLYVSRSCIKPEVAEIVVGSIVTEAILANERRSISGALLFTGSHFAQVIEGRDCEIDPLFASISGDRRHDEIIVVDRAPIAMRRFADWNMSYFGPSQFVARHVTRLLNASSVAEKNRASGWLTDLMRAFVAT